MMNMAKTGQISSNREQKGRRYQLMTFFFVSALKWRAAFVIRLRIFVVYINSS